MQTLKLKNFGSIIFILLLAACSDKSPDRSHRVGGSQALVQTKEVWNFAPASAEALSAMVSSNQSISSARQTALANLNAFDAEIASSAEAASAPEVRSRRRAIIAEFRDRAMRPLESIALNPAYSENRPLSNSSDMRWVFREFNTALLALVRADIVYARESGLLDQFWAMASVGCEEGFRRGCAASRLLSSNPESAAILEAYAWDLDRRILELEAAKASGSAAMSEAQYLAQRFELIALKFDAIRFAMNFQNFSPNHASRLALLNLLSNSQFAELPESRRTRELTNQQNQILVRITDQLPAMLENQNFRNDLRPYIEDKDILRRFSLRLQRQQREAVGSMQAGAQLAKVVCRHYRDSSAFTNSIKASLEESDAAGVKGFIADFNQMRSSENAAILTNLKMTRNFVADEQLFFIDQLFRGHWDSSITEECWNARRSSMSAQEKDADSRAFIKLVQDYIRVELVRRVISTNQFMSTVFQPLPGQARVATRDIFYRAIDESRSLTELWQGLVLRVDVLERFVKSSSGSMDRSSQSQEYRDFLIMKSSLQGNIKLLAVYPNMLLLSYYLAAKNFSVDIPTWYGGTIKLDSEMIINWILGEGSGNNQAARPLFNFGNDSRPIMTFENLYAYFFALKTNTFSTFADADAQASRTRESGEKVINDVNFFSEVIGRFTNREFLAATSSVQELERKLSGSEGYAQLQAICRVESGARTSGNGQQYKLDLSLTDLLSRTFVSLEDRGVGETFKEVYGFQTNENLGMVRNELYRKYLFLSTMVDLLEDHWKTQANASTDLSVGSYVDGENKLAEIRANFSGLFDSVRRYQNIVLSKHRELGDCMHTIARVESRQQNELYSKEVVFLRLVHRAIREMRQAVNANPSSQAELERVYTEAVNGKLAPGVAPDSLLAQLATEAKVYYSEAGDVRGFDQITAAGGYGYSRWNMALRLRNNLKDVNPNVNVSVPPLDVLPQFQIYNESSRPEATIQVRVNENMGEEEFIRVVLSTMEARKFVDWWDKSRKLGPFFDRLKTLSQLYLNESLGVFASARADCAPNDTRLSCQAASNAAVKNIELITESFKIAEMTHISPEDEVLLRRLNRRSKFAATEIKAFFLDNREMPHSLLEVPYAFLTSGRSLVTQAKNAMVAFNAMLSTGNTGTADASLESGNSSKELAFLAENDSVRRLTRVKYRPIVVNSFNRVRLFEQAAECFSRAHAQEREQDISYLYELDLLRGTPRSGKWINPHVPGRGPVYIEQRLINDHEDSIDEFHRDTRNAYRATPGETDFINRESNLDCAQILRQ